MRQTFVWQHDRDRRWQGITNDEREIILEAIGLHQEFHGFVAVNNVDLRVQNGSIHALIGPNGAGKTTCFNMVSKFLTPTRGTIRF